MSIPRASALRRAILVCLLPIVSSLPAQASEKAHSGDQALFSVSEYMGHIQHLASDELEGRGTGQPGIDRAAEYIADHFKKMGIKPAGDDDTYFQNFTLQLRHEIGAKTKLVFEGGEAPRKPALHEDYVPSAFAESGDFEGPLVFAGYGIVNEDENYDDYKGLDVEGKVVLVIRKAPAFGEFSVARDQTFMAKAARAKERKAAAMLIVNADDKEKLFEFDGGRRVRSYDIPIMHITRDLADELLKATDLPVLSELQKKIEDTRRPASAALSGISAAGCVEVEAIDSPVRNVVGLIPGTGPQKDEIIILGGHYDHLGIRNKDKPEFDAAKDISNGADDNASGTALVMQMARVFTQGQAPNRSIVLILFTGEELGLLGSAYFTSHPTVDLDNCVAMLNFDMVGRLKDSKLEVGGMRTGGFEEMVRELAEPYDLVIRDGGGGRGPSDHTHFYNHNIPVLFFFTGIHRQYHRPEDDVHLINGEGAIRVARFAADIIDRIDGSAARPEFAADTRRAAIGRQSDDDEPATQPVARADAPTGVRLGVTPGETTESGVLVAEVVPDSPADKAGIKPGDRIVRIGRTRIRAIEDAVTALSGLREGDETTINLFREGSRERVRVQFGEPRAADARPARRPSRAAPEGRQESPRGRRGAESRDIFEQFIRSVTREAPFEGLATGSSISLDERGGEITLHYRGEDMLGRMEDFAHRVGHLFIELAEQHPQRIGRYSVELNATYDSGSPRQSFHFTIRFERPAAGAAARDGNTARAHAGEPADPHGGRPGRGAASAAHGQVDDSAEVAEMPPVRLGIMPTYGEGEGEGFEIAGVVENGPAAKAGMKDGDRILKIGSHKVSNVYEYMDALRKFKPGETVPVTVLRDGQQVELKIKAEGPMVREAA